MLKFLKTYSYKDKRVLLSHLEEKGHKKPKQWKKIHSEVCGANEMNFDVKTLLKELSKKHGYSLTDKDKFFVNVVSNPNESSKLDKGEFRVRYRYDLAFDKLGQKKIQNNTREFCETLINRNLIYRREDINFMSLTGANPIAKQNYSIFKLKGHWNCRHAWKREVYVQIKDEDTVENNPIYGKVTLTENKNKNLKLKVMSKKVNISDDCKKAIASFNKQMNGKDLTKNEIVAVNEMLLGKLIFVDAKVDDKILRIDADAIEVGAAVSWIDEAGELMDVADGELTLTEEGKVIVIAAGIIETVTDIEEAAAEGEEEETELTQDEKFAALETKLTGTITEAIEGLTKSLNGKFSEIENSIKDIPAFEEEKVKKNFSSDVEKGNKRVSLSTPFNRK